MASLYLREHLTFDQAKVTLESSGEGDKKISLPKRHLYSGWCEKR